MTRSSKVDDFAVDRAGYLAFNTSTSNAVDAKGILAGSGFKNPLDPKFCRYIVTMAMRSLQPGQFDRDVVRFVIVMKNGHRLAIDQDGGIQIDGLSFTLSKTGFGQIVEAIAARYPKRARGEPVVEP